MWSDNESIHDYIGNQHLVGAIESLIRNPSLLPATIGVFGDWGSGKSSLLGMVGARFAKDKDILALTFNGWLFEGYEDAKTALMGTILDEIVARRKITAKGRDLILRLARNINLLRIAGLAAKTAAGYATAGTLGAIAMGGASMWDVASDIFKKAVDVKPDELAAFLKDNDPAQALRQGIRDFRRDFAELLDDTKVQTLVIVIDDLDRCLPNTVIETLEAIKLFLFTPRTAFVIGVDERLVRHAVRRRFPELPGDKVDIARDYLEKLIQFPVRIPPLGRADMETYINVLFAQRTPEAQRHFDAIREAIAAPSTNLFDVRFNQEIAAKMMGTVPQVLVEQLQIAERLAPLLAAGLAGNPRQAKRFLSSLMMRQEMAKTRGVVLNQRVLAKLMLLEYFRSETFKLLADEQGAGEGKSARFAAAEAELRGTASTKKQAKEEAAEAAPPMPALVLDPWLEDWFRSEPFLADEDLRAYFYFSRDTLGVITDAMRRMSPLAQEVFANLLEKSAALRNNALKSAAALSEADASAVFEALAARSRREEFPGADETAFKALLDLVGVRPQMLGQLLTMLSAFQTPVAPAAVAKMEQFAKNNPSHRAAVVKIVKQWSTSSDRLTKNAATIALKALS